MLVYHFPAFSGVNMGINEMRQFLEDDKFLGIKYTSNDFFTMEQCKANFPNKLVYNVADEDDIFVFFERFHEKFHKKIGYGDCP